MAEEMIKFNPNDLDSMIEIMDKHNGKDMLFGENEKGEKTVASIFKDRIEITTYQLNGWIRINVYWRDETIEELFEGRWER